MRRERGYGDGTLNYHQPIMGIREHETTDTYFVPSFSIRRHVSRTSEAKMKVMQDEVQRRLGKGFDVVMPSALTLKVINQRQFINRMREADLRPSPQEVRELAFTIRDGLTEVLQNAPSTLAVPLGQLGIFGRTNQALGIELQGWGGYKARYARHDDDGTMTAHGAIVSEMQYCMDSINEAFPIMESGHGVGGLVSTPHMTIARYGRDIRGSRLRDIRSILTDLIPAEVEIGDPVIELRESRMEPSDVLYVRHAWDTLATY